jgi:hypothetical protein
VDFSKVDVVDIDNFKKSHPWDIFVSNYQLDECSKTNKDANKDVYRWLQSQFQGKVVFWTPEDATNYKAIAIRNNYYELGPGLPREQRHVLMFLQAAFWAQLDGAEKESIGNPHRRPQSITTTTRRPHFLIYAHSHCVGVRQQAFRQIANAGNLPTVHYGGSCDGGVKHNVTKATRYKNNVQLSNWEDNRQLYQNFRFCLTMEHVNTPGYITEKILVAFWAGCIPIYWGTEEIFDIFNQEAFLFWNVKDPQATLERLYYLETNRTAYNEMTQQPILAPGALDRYFSLDDHFGGGVLKKTIRHFLGLDVFEFVSSKEPNNSSDFQTHK